MVGFLLCSVDLYDDVEFIAIGIVYGVVNVYRFVQFAVTFAGRGNLWGSVQNSEGGAPAEKVVVSVRSGAAPVARATVAPISPV